MAIKFGLWRVDGTQIKQLPPETIKSEKHLEEIIEARVEILGLGDLFVVGRQVITDFGKLIDLLAIDAQGDLYIIELKKDRTPREVVAQALEYGFWVKELSFEAISELYTKHHQGEDFDSGFTVHFEADLPEAVNTSHHLVVVASRIDTSTEQIVEYVRDYGVPINVLFFEYFRDDEREYLARGWLADPESEVASPTGKKQAPWSGQDFYVAIGGKGVTEDKKWRDWEDMRRYGFVSSGHGHKYHKAMSNLFEGARIWAYIPGSGYVGVGDVTQPAVPVSQFEVDIDGRRTPIMNAPLKATNMDHDAEDQDLRESLVRVDWKRTHAQAGGVSGGGHVRQPERGGKTPTSVHSPAPPRSLRSRRRFREALARHRHAHMISALTPCAAENFTTAGRAIAPQRHTVGEVTDARCAGRKANVG